MSVVSMASEMEMDVGSPEPVQKAPRRRKCKNNLALLAEMFPDVVYHIAASYGSSEDQVYVMEVNIEGKVLSIVLSDWHIIFQQRTGFLKATVFMTEISPAPLLL